MFFKTLLNGTIGEHIKDFFKIKWWKAKDD